MTERWSGRWTDQRGVDVIQVASLPTEAESGSPRLAAGWTCSSLRTRPAFPVFIHKLSIWDIQCKSEITIDIEYFFLEIEASSSCGAHINDTQMEDGWNAVFCEQLFIAPWVCVDIKVSQEKLNLPVQTRVYSQPCKKKGEEWQVAIPQGDGKDTLTQHGTIGHRHIGQWNLG
jgi:hypothetical protein